MIDTWIARLREPRSGVVVITAFVALLMASHWTPMALPAAIVIGLAILRPRDAISRVVWWALAAMWFTAIALEPARMEDHVYLFAVWLVALAVSLHQDTEEAFIEQAAWQARVLIGVTFTAAVGWKLAFNDFASGTALWLFMLVDYRFNPLATAVGLSEADMARDRLALTELLAGTSGALSLEAPSWVLWRITAVAVFALVIEGVIAVSYLASDSSRLAALRLPSIVLFAVLTYSVVPVVAFAALLAALALTAARWRSESMWVFPALVLMSATRALVINL